MVQTVINLRPGYGSGEVIDAIAARLPIDKEEISDVSIVKKELVFCDGEPSYKLTVAFMADSERMAGLLKMKKKVAEYIPPSFDIPWISDSARPLVVGAGPAGLFCALVLAEAGLCPIVIERGEDVDRRMKRVNSFLCGGALCTESNVQFGEGGAGTFSDGKLKVGGMDKYKWKVLSEFVKAGAPEEILYLKGAHLGTDKLPGIVKGIREYAISLGATFKFSAKLDDLSLTDCGIIARVLTESGEENIEATHLILATGHSARDTFEMLYSKGIPMRSKGFGIGMRLEHQREYINRLIYGDASYADACGTASYHLVTHLEGGRSVYSFCMCPGGTVVAATSERGCVVTNGMSEFGRMADNSNAAILVSVTPDDFGSDSPLAGIYYQRAIEERAFAAGGGDYRAPGTSVGGFMAGGAADATEVLPSYGVGVRCAPAEGYLPSYVTDSLRAGLVDFDKWLPGFMHHGAFLTGAETRTTSAVRIERGEDYSVPGFSAVYPIGEGAGYAGGIVSSAVDGVRCAESIISALL